MTLIRILMIFGCVILLSSCVLTKVVTVPLRVSGAIISIIPVAGNEAHDAIDKAADAVDKVPI